MNDPIDRQTAMNAFAEYVKRSNNSDFAPTPTWNNAVDIVENLPSVDAVEVVRCKDCKHRPTGESRDDLEFPDDKCPCKCEDYWYSWKPSDNWFCGNGERKDSNYRGERKYG